MPQPPRKPSSRIPLEKRFMVWRTSARFKHIFAFYSRRVQQHPYHMVDPSPWPFFASTAVFGLALSLVTLFNRYSFGTFLVQLSVCAVLLVVAHWAFDVVVEASYQGQHTYAVQCGLRYGVILFIVSEVMLFGSFFWAYFHFALVPSIFIGRQWPPAEVGLYWVDALDARTHHGRVPLNGPIGSREALLAEGGALFIDRGSYRFPVHEALNSSNLVWAEPLMTPWRVPFVNTLLLLSSGAAVTWSHRAWLRRKRIDAQDALLYTILLGLAFVWIQWIEYRTSFISIHHTVYGSIFYSLTGLHGFHVIVGLFLLALCWFRMRYLQHFTWLHHIGFEAAIWYWHFVDVVWICLFFVVYYWFSFDSIVSFIWVRTEFTSEWDVMVGPIVTRELPDILFIPVPDLIGPLLPEDMPTCWTTSDCATPTSSTTSDCAR